MNPRAYGEATAHTTVPEVEAGDGMASADTVAAVAAGRRQLVVQLRWLFITGSMLAVVLFGGAALQAKYRRIHHQKVIEQYNEALACLDQRDYLCARDRFGALAHEQPPFRDVQARLIEAHYGLSEIYATTGKWQAAIDELVAVVEADPNDIQAPQALRGMYDRWHQDAVSQGDWLTALRVSLQRRARFP